MAKYDLRIRARKLRAKGESVKVIAKTLGVSKSTVSLWVRDIILSVEQLEKLKHRSIKGRELGRLKGALVQKERSLLKLENSKNEAIKKIGPLNKRELLLVGAALYWAEGSKKHGRRVFFCNSDPDMINLFIRWLKVCYDIGIERLAVSVSINSIHKNRDFEIKKYWSEVTNIPLEQFRSTIFIDSKNKKTYKNYNVHYGTFRVGVLKSAQYFYDIIGLIKAISFVKMPA